MSVAYRSNIAYDTRRQDVHAEEKVSTQVRRRRKQANAMARTVAVFAVAVLVAAISIGLLYIKAQVYNVQLEVNKAQSDLKTVERKNSELNEQYNEAINVNTIMEKATQLGMSYPTGNQVLYVSVTGSAQTSMKNGK